MAKKPKAKTSAGDLNPEDVMMITTDSVIEYANNPRKNDEAVDAMETILATHGFRVPILVRSNRNGNYDLVDGHLRIKAARKLGLAEVPAILVDDMPDEQVKAFRISVNRAAELAEWDWAKLSEEIKGVGATFEDVPTLTGFDDEALARLLSDGEDESNARNAAQADNRHDPVTRQADKRSAKRDTDTVSLSLNMTAAEREEVMTGLDRVCKARGVETRSEAVLQLVRDALTVIAAETPAAPKPRRRRA